MVGDGGGEGVWGFLSSPPTSMRVTEHFSELVGRGLVSSWVSLGDFSFEIVDNFSLRLGVCLSVSIGDKHLT